MNRVHAGWCAVPNPFNKKQVSRIELNPKDTVIVFWTRWANPFLKAADELQQLGYRFYFQYTLINYPKEIETNTPPLGKAISAFLNLSERIGADRVIWRYDPILLTAGIDHTFHLDNFSHIASKIKDATKRVIISIADPYDKAARRLKQLGENSPNFRHRPYDHERDQELLLKMAEIAREHNLIIQSCAEEIDLASLGIQPGKCIDDFLIKDVFGLDVSHIKDKGQRTACGCVESREIGMYDSCLFGCSYCYATNSFIAAKKNHEMHNPQAESLFGDYHAPNTTPTSPFITVVDKPFQGDLFNLQE